MVQFIGEGPLIQLLKIRVFLKCPKEDFSRERIKSYELEEQIADKYLTRIFLGSRYKVSIDMFIWNLIKTWTFLIY